MNVFPAVVTMPDGTRLTACRVVWEPDHGTEVWWWDRSTRAAVVVLASPDAPVPRDGETGWYDLATVDRYTVTIHHDAEDCGCSHPMKRFQPRRPARATRLPRP